MKDGIAAIPIPWHTENIITKRAKRAIDLDFLKPKTLLLYTNCVMPSLVGSTYNSFLTQIPVQQEKDIDKMDIPFLVYEPKNLQYHPLKMGDLKDIQMKLLVSDGTKPVFAVDDIKIFITLLLRLRPFKNVLPSKQTAKKYFNFK